MSANLKRFLIFIGVLTGVLSANLGYNTHRENLVGWALLVVGVIGAAVGAIHLGVTMYRNSLRLDRRDAAFWLLLPGVAAVGMGSPLEFQYMAEILPRTDFLQVSGLILCGLGVLAAITGGGILRRLPRYGDSLSVQETVPAPTSSQVFMIEGGLWLGMFGITLGYSSLIGLGGCLLLLLPGAILRNKLGKESN